MSQVILPRQAALAFKSACLAELEALKPGNVHIFADGHGMQVRDFIKSADAAAEVIAQAGSGVGQRILSAVEASWAAVACNTNLGIVLLAAPLIEAALHGRQPTLQQRLQQVLHSLTVEDAEYAYRAIVMAKPAGLGHSAQHDVRQPPGVTLLQAMQQAEQRDRVAWQYAHGFSDIFTVGADAYNGALARWHNPAWATSAVYLQLLARYPDSHILRKQGASAALAVQQETRQHLQALLVQENPKRYQRELLKFDASLKQRGLNPGTSADLTVATVLAIYLQNALSPSAAVSR